MEIMTNVNLCTEDKALEKLLPEYQYDKKLFIEYTKVFWTFPLLVNTFIKSKYILHKTPTRCSLEHSMRVLNLCPLNSSHRHIHLHWISICVLQSFSLLFSIWPLHIRQISSIERAVMYTNLIIGLNRTVMKHQQSSKNGWYFREKIKHKITSQSFGV